MNIQKLFQVYILPLQLIYYAGLHVYAGNILYYYSSTYSLHFVYLKVNNNIGVQSFDGSQYFSVDMFFFQD